jgi:hypothetical protein
MGQDRLNGLLYAVLQAARLNGGFNKRSMDFV